MIYVLSRVNFTLKKFWMALSCNFIAPVPSLVILHSYNNFFLVYPSAAIVGLPMIATI